MYRGQIMVIDDAPYICNMIETLLSGVGYEVTCFTKAREALMSLSKGSPDLIICDIVMPEMDGFEFRRALTEDRRTAHIPFCFLTAKDDMELMIEGMNAGVLDYFKKPISSHIANVLPVSTPTPAPRVTSVPAPTSTAKKACPTVVTAGQITDGRISVAAPATFTDHRGAPEWGTCGSQAIRKLADKWYSVIIVGTVPAETKTPEQVAAALWKWNVDKNYSTNPKVTVASSAAQTVQGHAAWVMRGTVEQSNVGDDVTLIVISGSDGQFSTLLAVSTIGNAENKAEVDAAIASLKVG